MGKHIEFGKDLGLMAEVVRRGLTVGIGHWQFWERLAKPQSGLWFEMLLFGNAVTPEEIAASSSWHPGVIAGKHYRAPDIDTLDMVVREGRAAGFEKPEWQLLLEDVSFFQAMIQYLRLAPPFSIFVEVNYDRIPPYRDGYSPRLWHSQKKGLAGCQMSIYTPRKDWDLVSIVLYLNVRGWRFGDQHELYAFGIKTKESVRPWAINDTKPIYGPGSISKSLGFQQFPRLWTLRGNQELDLGSCVVGDKSVSTDDHFLIVKK